MKNPKNGCRLSTVDRRLFVFFLLVLPFLQGCSLLFVAKGGTHYGQGSGQKAPEAASLAQQMSGQVVVEYKVKEGETFAIIAERYYGRASKGVKLAQRNNLPHDKPLKVGTVLRIVDPIHFADPKETHKKTAKNEGPKSKVTPSPGTAIATPTPTATHAQENITKVARPKINKAFAPGEVLKFELRALGVLGGYASLSVEDYQTVNKRPCVPLVVRANSVFPFTAIYAVNDVQSSYFDTIDFISWKFQNKVHEGNYKARNLELYDQIKHKVTRQHNDEPAEIIDIAPFSQDIISCFYYFRLLPLEEGKTYDIPTQSGGKNFHLIVSVFNKEKITVPAGTFECFRVKPLIKHGTVFRNEEDIDLWMTADQRHIPVKIKSGIVIGSIDVDLLEATLPPIK
jgi:hypothetical protein